MNTPRFIFTLSLAVCVAMLCVVGIQHRQLRTLRSRGEQQQKPAQASAQTDVPRAAPPTPSALSPSLVHELLQLRNQVGQLRRRRDELLPARAEHERLILQLGARGTNSPTLPPNYIRKAQARLVGYNTPEDTLQSFLWALRNHDITNFLQALTAEQSRWYQADTQRAGTFAKLFDHPELFIGFSIVNTQRFQDGTLQADLELAPGLPPIPVNLQQIESQWKISSFP